MQLLGDGSSTSFGTNVGPDSNLEISNITTMASADPNTIITQKKELDLEDLLQENSESANSKKAKSKIRFVENTKEETE